MTDEPASSALTEKASVPSSAPASLPYAWLRGTIRSTGVLLMFGGMIYLGSVAWDLIAGRLIYHQATDGVYILVVSLLAFGLGYFVFRVGLSMLRSINASTISSFSFLFAIVYTFILMHLLPALGLFHQHPTLTLLFVLVYFGLSYLILKRILILLLLPKE